MINATKFGHAHGEAFCLMWYGCKCGHKEQIWNSRDGVTPFCMTCPSCGEIDLQHTHFGSDTYTPNHLLHTGQKYWRDGTMVEAVEIMRKRIDAYPELITPEGAARLIDDIRNGCSMEFQRGWPMLGIKQYG
jgi:hypothetical protein